MAVFTDVRRQGVCRAFARCVCTIMAVYAVTGDARVIEGRGQPAIRRMAVVACVAAGDMCRVLARSKHAVMTAVAGSDYLRVIDGKRRGENIRAVAVLTNIC